jgi:hypothetical protein
MGSANIERISKALANMITRGISETQSGPELKAAKKRLEGITQV